VDGDCRQLDEEDFDEGTCWKHPSYLLRPRIISLSRIHVQIPYVGSESELPEERARQASEEVNWLNKSENSRLPLLRIPANLAQLPERKVGDHWTASRWLHLLPPDDQYARNSPWDPC
jgi:hypothetical protein